jgi:hypothetical protein
MLGELCGTPLFSVMHPPAHASNSVPDEGITLVKVAKSLGNGRETSVARWSEAGNHKPLDSQFIPTLENTICFWP